MRGIKRAAVVIGAVAFPVVAVMFCAARTDLMNAPVTVRFGLLVTSLACALLATALTDQGKQ